MTARLLAWTMLRLECIRCTHRHKINCEFIRLLIAVYSELSDGPFSIAHQCLSLGSLSPSWEQESVKCSFWGDDATDGDYCALTLDIVCLSNIFILSISHCPIFVSMCTCTSHIYLLIASCYHQFIIQSSSPHPTSNYEGGDAKKHKYKIRICRPVAAGKLACVFRP